MALLWALAGLLVGSLLNLLIYQLLRMEKASEPVASFRPPAPRPVSRRSALLHVVTSRASRDDAGKPGPGWTEAGVEVATAVAFGLLYLRFGPDSRLLVTSLYSCILLVVFVVDLQRHLIYNAVTYPSLIAAALLSTLVLGVPVVVTVAGVVAGGAIFGALYAFGRLVFRREALGRGDVDLAMVLGAMVGFPAIVVTLLLASVIGGVAAVGLLVRGRSGREFMPYGPIMCLGAYATFFLSVPSLFP